MGKVLTDGRYVDMRSIRGDLVVAEEKQRQIKELQHSVELIHRQAVMDLVQLGAFDCLGINKRKVFSARWD